MCRSETRTPGSPDLFAYDLYIYIYEPCCKLSCIVSRIEVTLTHGFEGFT